MNKFFSMTSMVTVLFGCGGGGAYNEGDTRVDHAGGVDNQVEALAPESCTDDQGRVHVTWYDQRGGQNSVWYNRSIDGGVSWQTGDTQLNLGSNGAAMLPTIACVDNRVYIAWQDHRDGELENGNIYFNYSNDSGSTFLANAVALDADPDGENISLAPQIAAVGSAVHVVWFDARNGANDIYANSSTDGGDTWQPTPVRVDGDEAGASYSAAPVLAVGDSGEVVVAWEDSRSGGSDIYVNYSSNFGQSFAGSDVRLDEGGGGSADSFLPQITMSGSDVYAVWHDTIGGEGREVYLAHSGDGGATWDAPVRAETDAPGLHDALYPSVSAVGSTVYVAWQDDRYGGYDVFLRRSSDAGQTWDFEEYRMDRTTEGSSHSYKAQVTAWEDQTVVVMWEDLRSDGEGVGFNDLYYNFSVDGGEMWSQSDFRINSDLPGSAYAVTPNIGRNQGELYFVWADGRYGSSTVFFNSLAIGEASVYIPPED